MRQLLLLRHADASNEASVDRERPLSSRGRQEAIEIASHIVELDRRPTHVLCSSALRTRQTLAEIERAWPATFPPTEIEEAIYLASASQLASRVRELPNELSSVLVVAHNPGITQLAVDLAGEGDREAYEELRRGMVPAALCQLEFECSWAEVGPAAGRLTAFTRPT